MLQRLKRRENTQTRDAITFPEAFQFLITQADVCDYVIKMTGEYLEPFLSLQTQYKDTMKDLINCHKEIISLVNEEELPQITERHLQEINAMHENWFRQIYTLTQSQSKQYQDAILDVYDGIVGKTFVIPIEPVTSDVEKPRSAPLDALSSAAQESNPDDMNEKNLKALMEMGFNHSMAKGALDAAQGHMEQAVMMLLENPKSVEDFIEKEKLNMQRERDKKNPSGGSPLLQKSNSFFNISNSSRSSKTDIPPIDWSRKRTPKPTVANPFKNMGNFFEKAIDAFRNEDQSNREQPQGETTLSDTFTVHIGTQQIRTMYNMQLCVMDNVEALSGQTEDPLQAKAVQFSMMRSIYTKNLNGIIVLVKKSELYSYSRGEGSNSELFSICQKSPELHFESIWAQIDGFLKENGNTAREGDFFVTRHSNIPSVHVVFHLIVHDEDSLNRTDLIQGYRSILLLAHLCHITRLIIPVTLSLPSNLSKDTTLRRAEGTLKHAKGVFTELSRHVGIDHVPRQIVFLLSKYEPKDLFEQIRERLLAIFRTL